MRTGEDHPESRHRGRLRLRGAAAIILGVSVVLAVIRPQLREAGHWIERRIQSRIHRGDLYEHLNRGRNVAEEFMAAVQAGKLDVARRLMTTGCRRRLTPPALNGFLAAHPILSGPCTMTNGFIKAPEGWPESEYRFQCGPTPGRSTIIRVILVSEYGEVKVDRIRVEGTN